MSFRKDLKEHIALAEGMKREAIRLAEHGCMCMDQAVKECTSLTVERTGAYEWTLYGSVRGWYRRNRVACVLPSPDTTKSQARVISYGRDSRGETCSAIDCEGRQCVEYHIRKAIVAFLV
jgi:hypothetical protein